MPSKLTISCLNELISNWSRYLNDYASFADFKFNQTEQELEGQEIAVRILEQKLRLVEAVQQETETQSQETQNNQNKTELD